MKRKFLFLAVLCLPFLGICQDASTTLGMTGKSGIKWVEGLSWQHVKEKAKKENKYIFVDCFATWCKPCKEMDTKVYIVDSVGDYLNSGFISVKLQMDQTKNDDVIVKSWYKTATEVGRKYRISAYPAYLFFAPNGEVVSKETGYKDPGAFIQAARNATIPSKQYFVLLKNYKQGKLDHSGTVSLIKMAKQIGDTADYRQLLNSYYTYLRKQKKEKLYTKENIEFIASTLDRSNMMLFDMFYPNEKEVNRVMQSDWYSQKVVDEVIRKEKINPFLRQFEGKPEPDWRPLFNIIAKDYKGDYADRNVMEAKMTWYFFYGDMLKYATILNDKMEKYGSDTTLVGEDFKLNNKAFLIWEKVNDVLELKRIIVWMEGVVSRGEKAPKSYIGYWPYYIDTYANLLHKVGRTAEAIKWEEYALSKGKEVGNSKGDLEEYQEKLDKMKKGEPTWPIEVK